MSRRSVRRGFFITFDGLDGCGKSSQADLLAKRLQSEGRKVVTTREPGGGTIPEKIRAILLDPCNTPMAVECEILLYLAARAQHVRERVLPALRADKIVICDRFQEATFAYQGFGRGIPLDFLQRTNSFATGDLIPDLTFIFDLPIEIAAERLASADKSPDRLERSGRSFFEKVRKGYLNLAAASPDRIIVMDGTLSIDTLAEKVYAAVIDKIKNKKWLFSHRLSGIASQM